MTEENFWRMVTIIIAATGPAWLYYKERKAVVDKARTISNASSDERQQSNQVFNQVGESKTQATLLETYANMSNHLITSNNGHMTALTSSVVEGFKESIKAIVDGNGEITLVILDRFKEVSIEQTKQAAAINQLNYFLQERAGQPIAGADSNPLKAAELRTEAVQRSENIREAVDADIQAKRDDAAHPHESPTVAEPPTVAAGQQVIAIVKAEPSEGS